MIPALLIVIFLAAGCGLSRQQSYQREFFLLDVASVPPGSRNHDDIPFPEVILLIQPVGMAAAFDRKEFVYRTGQYSYETDYYRAFQVPPAILIGEQSYEWLVSKHLFGQTVRPGSLVRPNFALYGFVNEFYGDYSNPASHAAVISVTYRVLGRSKKIFSNLRMEKTYTQRIPLADREVGTLVAAWNRALRNILTELTADLRKVDFSIRTPEAAHSPSAQKTGDSPQTGNPAPATNPVANP